MARTDAKKIEMIAFIVDTQASAQNDEDGDKFHADAYLAMEAITAVIDDVAVSDSGALRTFIWEEG